MSHFHRSEEQVRADFPQDNPPMEHPWRCTLCSRMKRSTDPLFYVSSSASFFKNEPYESLVIGGEAASRTGACMDCLRSRPS